MGKVQNAKAAKFEQARTKDRNAVHSASQKKADAQSKARQPAGHA
jgi:hypothetical protein